ncbi:hypothetical protein RYX36_005071 [Vicia faba]
MKVVCCREDKFEACERKVEGSCELRSKVEVRELFMKAGFGSISDMVWHRMSKVLRAFDSRFMEDSNK